MGNLAYSIIPGIYALIFCVIGIFGGGKLKEFKDFAVAGKKQSTFMTTMTLLATTIGASATIGIADTTYSIGFPAFWWLCFGGIGLILQALLISEKVRSMDADTLPDLASKLVGGAAEKTISFIIVISWIGVIAGQLVAMSSFVTFITGKEGRLVFIIVTILALLYTVAGGQMSVVKTDMVQFLVIAVGFVVILVYLYLVKGDASGEVFKNIELINENYGRHSLVTQFFVIGGVYFLGPDIISRNFISKDKKTAKKAALIGGAALIVFAIVIVMTGMWARFNIPAAEKGDMKTLLYVIKFVPLPVGLLLSLGLLSAMLSSLDTCLVNASIIFVKDILKKENVLLVRITILVIGVMAMTFALMGNGDIISLLSAAYSVYTPGVIFPLLIAIIVYGKKGIRRPVWLAAVIAGGSFGIIGNLPSGFTEFLPGFVVSNLNLFGMAVSLILALLSITDKNHQAVVSPEEAP